MTTGKAFDGKSLFRKTYMAVAVVSMFLPTAYSTTIVDIADEATVDIVASGYNGHSGGTESEVSVAAHALRFGKDVTITLDASAAVNGVFTLYANLYATNGSFTVDATGIDVIHWVGGVQTSGKVFVKGAKEVHFGEKEKLSSPNGKISFSYFNTDVEFENEAATGLVFTNAVTCAKLPTSCSWSITPGMRVAVAANGLLGGGAATFTLADYDITLISTKGIAAGTIIVPSGRTLEVRQCAWVPFNTSGSNAGRWTWSGGANQHVTNNLQFASGSVFYVDGGQPDIYFDGDISGETTLTASIGNAPGTIHFTAAVSLAGSVALNNNTSFNLSGAGPFSFGTVSSASKVREITGADGRVLSIAALAANSRIGIGSSLDFRLGTIGAGATISLLGEGPWSVTGPDDGAPLDFAGVLVPATSGGVLSVGGRVSLGDVGTTYSALTFLPGTVVSNTTFDAATLISGNVTFAPTLDWKDKVAFWADASDPDSFMTVREFSPEVDTSKIAANKIVWWYDCRNTASWSNSIAFAMCRFAASNYSTASGIGKYPDMYPEVDSSEGLNGLSIVKCSKSTQTRMGLISANAVIRDNYAVWTPVDTAYAMVVARNVKSNAGAAILTTANGSLCASTTGYNANIFTNEALTVYRDGALVNQTSTTWGNSVWGVYSFTAEGTKVQGLTSKTNPGSSSDGNGGFDYAEILLFSEMPTEAERKYAEEYLAEKWGLSCAHSNTVKADEYTFALGLVPSDDAIIACAGDSIPHSVTVNLSFASRPSVGTYALMSNAEFTSVTLGTVSGIDANRISLNYDSTARTLSAEVKAKGTMLFFK